MRDKLLEMREGLGAEGADDVGRPPSLVNLEAVAVEDEARWKTEVAQLAQWPEILIRECSP